jgi:hypothetical protein
MHANSHREWTRMKANRSPEPRKLSGEHSPGWTGRSFTQMRGDAVERCLACEADGRETGNSRKRAQRTQRDTKRRQKGTQGITLTIQLLSLWPFG